MAHAKIIKGRVIENSPAVLVALVQGYDGSDLTQADITSITCDVYDMTTGDKVGDTATFDKADCVFDARQKNDGRAYDSTGYNFAPTLSGDYFPDGNTTYAAEVTITPTDGEPFVAVIYHLECINRFGA